MKTGVYDVHKKTLCGQTQTLSVVIVSFMYTYIQMPFLHVLNT